MLKIIEVLVAVFLASTVWASGGKVQANNPVLSEGECSVVVPRVVDLDNCVTSPAPDQSGLQVLICDSLVVCQDDSEDSGPPRRGR